MQNRLFRSSRRSFPAPHEAAQSSRPHGPVSARGDVIDQESFEVFQVGLSPLSFRRLLL